MVDAVVKIEQLDTASNSESIRDKDLSSAGSFKVRDFVGTSNGSLLQGHLPAITNPRASDELSGWQTEDREHWSDSPAFQPYLLYRYRFGWGRDSKELPELVLGSSGQRLGNVDDNSGLLIYQREYAINSSVTPEEFLVQSESRVDQYVTSSEASLEQMRHLTFPEGEQTVQEFPFLLLAVPAPLSEKNSVDTDVFIRLSNFTNPIDSSTIKMYLDGEQKTPLDIQVFSGGSGGFDVTWENDKDFQYNEQVNVRVEFSDTDTPANSIVIKYVFFTVADLKKPIIRNVIPSHGATNVSVSNSIQFEILDNEHDVEISTLRLYVNGRLVKDGESGTVTTTRLESDSGYLVKYTPTDPFRYGDLIPVAIFVKDISEAQNELFYTFSFTTIESNAPRLLNTDPSACSKNVYVGQDIRMTIIDGGHGLRKDTIAITVDETERNIQLVPVVHRDD